MSSSGPYKIEGNIGIPSPNYSGGFILTDELGVKYYFGKFDSDYGAIETTSAYISSWFLAKIENTFGEVIRLKYETINAGVLSTSKIIGTLVDIQTKPIFDDPLGHLVYEAHELFPFTENPSIPVRTTKQTPFSMAYVKEIEFPNGKIVFNYDLENARLNTILLKDNNASTVKSYEFLYVTLNNAALPNNNSVAPSDVISKNAQGNEISRYRFEYNPESISTLRDVFVRSRDWWGYYNASATNTTVNIPYFENIPVTGGVGLNIPSTIGTANIKEPNFSVLMGGSLKKIIYPTGGSVEFKYESNQYFVSGMPPLKTGPGMRLQEKIVLDGNGGGYRLVFKYGIGENGAGTLVYMPNKYDYVTETREVESPYLYYEYPYPISILSRAYRKRVYSSEINDQISGAYSIPIYYTTIAEYKYPLVGSSSLGKTVYYYDIPEYQVNINNTPTAVMFDEGAAGPATYDPSISYRNIIKNEGTDAQVVLKETYKSEPGEPTGYKKIASVYYENLTARLVSIPELLMQSFVNYNYGDGTGTKNSQRKSKAEYYSTTLEYPTYVISQTFLKGTYKRVSKTIETSYDNSGNIIVTTNFYYDNLNHLYPTRKITTNSKGFEIGTYITYPSDYPAGTSFIDDLKSKNVLALPVEEVEVKSDAGVSWILKGKISKYKIGGAGLLEETQFLGNTKPIETGSFKFSNRAVGQLPPNGVSSVFNSDNLYSKEIEIIQYDTKGNLLEMQKTNDVKQSYVWDYNSTYPIAEVINSPVSDIAHTSFEADGKGNWSFSGTPAADATAPTGKKAYTLGSSITKSGLSTTTTYIVSYWKKSGTVAVNGTTPITGRTINGWTYHEHKIVNPTGGLITVSGTSGIIDELRLYPAGAQMTTYTYDPLIGMTSQCDTNNRITYYEYDGFGRLQTVRDQDRNVLKTYDYQYQQNNNQ